MAIRALPCGTRVLDAGVAVQGGLAVGRGMAEPCMGGLGHVQPMSLTIGRESWPGMQVWTGPFRELCPGPR